MDAIGEYAYDQQRRGLRPATIATRRGILRSLERHHSPIQTATSAKIEQWLDALPLSPRSRYSYISAVAAFFEFACRRGLAKRDPTNEIVRPRLGRLVPRPAAVADVEHALSQADTMLSAWICLAAFQGFRCMEIAQLRREDVLDDRDPPLIVVADGKGGHQAILTLNQLTELALRNHGLPRSGLLFRKRDGGSYPPQTVSRYGNAFLRSVGCEFTFHQLRHLFVTLVWQATHDIRITQEMARHRDTKTTAGYAAYDDQRAATVVRGLTLAPFAGADLP